MLIKSKYLPIASGSSLGAIKIGSGLSVDGSGVVSVVVAASAVTYSNTTSGLTAVTTQAAIDEVLTRTRGIEKHVDITSSANVLTLNTAYSINCHLLTQSTVLSVPNTTGWVNGDSVRIDLFVKVDAAGSYAMTFNSGWMFDGGASPILTATANAVDHLVITVVKSAAVGTVAVVGLAAADVKVGS